MKVALVHDYLTEYGGAERVLEAIHEIWSEAPVFTSLTKKDVAAELALLLERAKQASLLQNIPLASRLAKSFTFFMPLVFENMDLRDYDVVISDGTIWSKGVLTTPEQLHIFYCHTPPRWLYGYPGETDRRRLWYLQPILKPLDNWLRVWDFETAQRPDFIVANSQEVAKRIKKFWRREAKVIYPSVDLSIITPSATSQVCCVATTGLSTCEVAGDGGDYFLVVSRLSAYKNVDIAIEACNKLQLPLAVVGTGREEERLKKLAGPTVKFLKNLPDAELVEIYQNCRALIHSASDEDFGIAPVEAMSFGKPVIALRSGGVTETVVGGKTGIFFDEPTVESLVGGIKGLKDLKSIKENCVEQAKKFSKERFQEEFREFVESRWRERFKG
jgi:glycosyltransferase involved in cell wall biosynthesis